jgi:hypothetical protein
VSLNINTHWPWSQLDLSSLGPRTSSFYTFCKASCELAGSNKLHPAVGVLAFHFHHGTVGIYILWRSRITKSINSADQLLCCMIRQLSFFFSKGVQLITPLCMHCGLSFKCTSWEVLGRSHSTPRQPWVWVCQVQSPTAPSLETEFTWMILMGSGTTGFLRFTSLGAAWAESTSCIPLPPPRFILDRHQAAGQWWRQRSGEV